MSDGKPDVIPLDQHRELVELRDLRDRLLAMAVDDEMMKSHLGVEVARLDKQVERLKGWLKQETAHRRYVERERDTALRRHAAERSRANAAVAMRADMQVRLEHAEKRLRGAMAEIHELRAELARQHALEDRVARLEARHEG